MPLREYECGECGHRFEVLILGPRDEEGLICPDCRGQRLRLLPSTFRMGGEAGCVSCTTQSCGSCKGGR